MRVARAGRPWFARTTLIAQVGPSDALVSGDSKPSPLSALFSATSIICTSHLFDYHMRKKNSPICCHEQRLGPIDIFYRVHFSVSTGNSSLVVHNCMSDSFPCLLLLCALPQLGFANVMLHTNLSLPCSMVSRAWRQVFVPILWHAVVEYDPFWRKLYV